MPNYTPNLNLVKPLLTEQYDIAKVTNENADKIDLLLAPKANPTFTGLTELPLTTTLGGQDIRTLLMPKNWIINGMFDVWQRGTTQTAFSGYGSDDRWFNGNTASTKTITRESFIVGQTEVPNNPTYFSRTIVVSGTDSVTYKQQRIEDVTKLAGKTVTLSFWAKANANKNLSIEFTQNFGSGGSGGINSIGVQKFALTTIWQKFTKTVTLPSVVGKTIGVSSFLQLTIWFDANSSSNARTDSLGNQSGTFDIANVSLVEGSVAVECQNQPYADVLRDCQQYYFRIQAQNTYSTYALGFCVDTVNANFLLTFPITLRTNAYTLEYLNVALTDVNVAYRTISSLSIFNVTKNNCEIRAISSSLTQFKVSTLVSNGTTDSYIALSDEL